MPQLTQVFQMQNDLQMFLGQDFSSLEIEDRAALIKEYCLHTQIELAELLQELPFLKGWKNYSEMTVEEIAEQMSKARKEAVDVLHFYVNICLLLGFDGEQLHEAYMTKNQENYRRQKEELNKGMRYSYDGAS